jgi:hypothetical protein
MVSNRHALPITAILSLVSIATSLGACGSANRSSNFQISNGMILQPVGVEEAWSLGVPIGDTELDSLLTQSLQESGLPGVGVHVWNDGMGEGMIILYGFVATLNQRAEAEEQARENFSDFRLPISNRIRVRLELLALTPVGTQIEISFERQV